VNNTWQIEISSPLLRPGIVIRTEISEKYLVKALEQAMVMVREFNAKGSAERSKP